MLSLSISPSGVGGFLLGRSSRDMDRGHRAAKTTSALILARGARNGGIAAVTMRA